MRRALAVALLLVANAASGSDELRLVTERHSLTATWRTYHQFIDGVEVIGSAVIERVDNDGSVHEVARMLARPSGRRRVVQVRGGEPVHLNVAGEARPAYRLIVKERPLEPVARYIDAESGALLRSEPLFWNAKGRVFDPNPVAKLNDPALRDNNDAATAVPDTAYSVVDLPDVPASGPLAGPNVAIVDTEEPFTPRADAAQPLLFDRSQPQFEEVNAYFHIDRSQRWLQSLGYVGARRVVGYAIPVDPHAAGGADNSYYISGGNGSGALFFGDGGTDDAEDSDIMLHEFGHAIQDWIAPGAFGGPASAQARAIGEGFGDYWSFSSNYAGTAASGRDPFCIADWDARCFGDDSSQNCAYPAGADCLRRVDSTKTMADYLQDDTAGTEHLNGEIWSSALREIFMANVLQNGVEQGRRITDSIVIEATFGVPPNPTFNVMGRKLLDADRALYGGAQASVICTALVKRAIIATADCGVLPRGEPTMFQSPDHGLAIPDNNAAGITSTLTVSDTRPVDTLQVRVDIEHPSRGDLQIVLIAPDGTTVRLQNPSLDRNPDVHATFGFDTEPAESLARFSNKPIDGRWQLVVSDTRAGEVGRVISWALVVKFHGDEPLAQRPFSMIARQHIAAVAHTGGADGAQWRSDLFLFNRGPSNANVTVIYTPTGTNGTTSFGAVNVSIPPGQTTVFRDVLAQLFNANGLGTLELQGDVVAFSRTYNDGFAEVIEPVSSAEAIGAGDAAEGAIGLMSTPPRRTNLGIVETAGEAGTVRLKAVGGLRNVVWTKDIDLQPYEHVQLPLPPPPTLDVLYVTFTVTGGGARIHAYASLIAPPDAVFIAARQARGGTVVIPVVGNIQGLNGIRWITGRQWQNVLPAGAPTATGIYYSADGALAMTDTTNGGGFDTGGASRIDGRGFALLELPDGFLAWARTEANFGKGGGDEVVPVPVTEALGSGDVADAIRVENDAAFRTNIGATEVGAGSAVVRFTLFDSAGNALGHVDKFIGLHRQVQFSILEMSTVSVADGRVHVEVLSGDGRVVAYASVVNNSSSDAEFVRAR